jgi:hypothetical protein
MRLSERSSCLLLCAATGLLAACGEGKLGGSVDVNGTISEVASCQQGEGGGEAWVDVLLRSGDRLRLLTKGPADASRSKYQWLPKGTNDPVLLRCSWSSTSFSNVFGNLKGSAKLTCAAPGYAVKADVSYANCGKQAKNEI